MTAPAARAATIDEVIARLDGIVDRSIADGDRAGLFAALYRLVTVTVKRGIAANKFEDGARMERLDVTFANRYLDAFDAYRAGRPLSRSWRLAFDAARSSRPVIMQHLLLGMNAHINLDLGVAAAEVCPGPAIDGLKNDFDSINAVLAQLETRVEQEVCSLSPWIDRLDHIDPNAGRVVANFSIARARAASWDVATSLAALDGAARASAIAEIDERVAVIGALVRNPVGFLMNFNVWLVWLRETHDARRAIRVLAELPAASLT